MNAFCRAFWALVVTALLDVATQAQQNVESRQESRQAVQQYLNSLDGVKLGKRLQILPLPSDDLRMIFDQCEFLLLRFPRYPVEVVPMEPLRVNNLFAVCDQKVTRISDDAELKNFFMQRFPSSLNAEMRALGVRAWLRLAQELHQDGFIQFENPSISAGESNVEGNLKAIEGSGEGKLKVVMEFTSGKLSKLSFEGDIVPGARRLK